MAAVAGSGVAAPRGSSARPPEERSAHAEARRKARRRRRRRAWFNGFCWGAVLTGILLISVWLVFHEIFKIRPEGHRSLIEAIKE